MYGLKQASHAWCKKFIERLLRLNFKQFNLGDVTIFVMKVGRSIVYLVVYVDDILMIWNNGSCIASINKELVNEFEMAYLGHLTTT